MQNLPPNIEPTHVDTNSIDQLSSLNDNTNLLNYIAENKYRDDYIKHMRRTNFFSEEKVKFKAKEPPNSGNQPFNSEIRSKTIVTIISIIIMILIIIVVIKKQKRYRKEDLDFLEMNPNAPYSFFRDLRGTELGLNALIISEIFIYFIVFCAALHMLNKISTKTQQAIC